MGLCQPARCGCGIRSSTLTVRGSGNEGDPFVIEGTNPPVYTEATLPGAGVRYTGMVVSTTDTMRLLRWSGSLWTVLSEPPQTWTPVITQGVAITSSGLAYYQRTNNTAHYFLHITMSSAGTAAQIIVVGGVPKAFADAAGFTGSFRYFDPGVNNYNGTVGGQSTTSMILSPAISNNALGPYTGMAVASGDVLESEFWGQITAAAGAL